MKKTNELNEQHLSSPQPGHPAYEPSKLDQLAAQLTVIHAENAFLRNQLQSAQNNAQPTTACIIPNLVKKPVLADMFHVCTRQIEVLVNRGMPSVKVGRKCILFDVADCVEWLKTQYEIKGRLSSYTPRSAGKAAKR